MRSLHLIPVVLVWGHLGGIPVYSHRSQAHAEPLTQPCNFQQLPNTELWHMGKEHQGLSIKFQSVLTRIARSNLIMEELWWVYSCSNYNHVLRSMVVISSCWTDFQFQFPMETLPHKQKNCYTRRPSSGQRWALHTALFMHTTAHLVAALHSRTAVAFTKTSVDGL